MPNHYTTFAICSPGHNFDTDAFNEAAKNDGNLCQIVDPMPEEIQGEAPGPNPPWYEFAMEHWGTKWGTYWLHAHPVSAGDGCPVIIHFCSAWGAPKILPKIARYLCETYGFRTILFLGFDPYDGSTTVLLEHPGTASDTGGEIVCETYGVRTITIDPAADAEPAD